MSITPSDNEASCVPIYTFETLLVCLFRTLRQQSRALDMIDSFMIASHTDNRTQSKKKPIAHIITCFQFLILLQVLTCEHIAIWTFVESNSMSPSSQFVATSSATAACRGVGGWCANRVRAQLRTYMKPRNILGRVASPVRPNRTISSFWIVRRRDVKILATRIRGWSFSICFSF